MLRSLPILYGDTDCVHVDSDYGTTMNTMIQNRKNEKNKSKKLEELELTLGMENKKENYVVEDHIDSLIERDDDDEAEEEIKKDSKEKRYRWVVWRDAMHGRYTGKR